MCDFIIAYRFRISTGAKKVYKYGQWPLTMRAQAGGYRYTIGFGSVSFSGTDIVL